MSKLVTRLSLILFSLDTGNILHVLNLHTFDISPCSCKHVWSRFYKRFSLLVSTCWEICVLMVYQIDLCHLGVLPVVYYVLAVTFELFIFLASCLTLLAGNLSRSMLLSLIFLETYFSSLGKNH